MPSKSKAQQRFMGMVRSAQKGEKPASAKVAKVAKSIGKGDAKDFASKCASRGSKDPEALSLSGQVWITMRSSEKRWFKRAEDYLEKALKRYKEHEGSMYWFGVAHLYNYQL